MNSKAYTAIAIARWISGRVRIDNDFACEGLQPLDVEVLFRELAREPLFIEVASKFSIAISGQGVNPVDMEELARKARLENIREFTDDLHKAAEWRNNRRQHPRSIVLASGYNAGVHTLNHYARPSSADLAKALLIDARVQLNNRTLNSPDVHRSLLATLVEDPNLSPLLSLESCAGFLALWDTLRQTKENQAPCFALTALGLLADENLFGKNDLGKRLALNLEITQKVRTLRSSFIQKLSKRKYRDEEKRRLVGESILSVERYLKAIQSGCEEPLDLDAALTVVRPPKDEGKQRVEENDDEAREQNDESTEDSSSFAKESSDALLDGREEDLEAISDAIEQAWEDRDMNDDDEVNITVTLEEGGQAIQDKTNIAVDVLNWVNDFCNERNWGGYFETSETAVRTALAGTADQSPKFLKPSSIVVIEGETLSLESILEAWDEDLKSLIGAETHLAETWREFSALRSLLLPHLGKLVYHPRVWLDGRPRMLNEIRKYLDLAATLYQETQEHYRVMASSSPAWAHAALEALLALDIVQIRVVQPEGKQLAKAVLLPTHPLHLWRNERLSTLLRGLAQSKKMGEDERETVRKELERPEQFLSVVRLSSLPDGLGLGQMLPYTSQIEGLPLFENLSNACSGPDGARVLRQAMEQFILLHPNHPFPLRMSLVNPPRGEELIMETVRLLNDHRYRGGQRISAIDLELYASGQHRERLYDALCFQDAKKEDELQEKVANDRLRIRVNDENLTSSTNLLSVVEKLRDRPSHIVAIFDESTIRLRQQSLGRVLPMSPFCVRYDIRLDRRSGKIDLRPQPGDSPFSEFLQLMNELDGNQRDGTIQVYADAEDLADMADELLQGDRPATRWLFLADRALPSEAGMNSVRIWERREGLRDTFLATRDFSTLARLLRPVFSRCNITLTPGAMNRLLHQGARLLGSGLLEIIKKQDGQPDQKKVIGLAGLLFAAKDLQRRFPGALVLSVDHPLARLWLRTGSRSLSERCDLLMLWENKSTSSFELTAVEVKSSDEEHLTNAPARLAHAVEQIGNTLDAVADGFGAAGAGQASPLSIPRCEMLKQTLARAALARSGDPKMDRANRIKWGNWLVRLFEQEDAGAPRISLRGCVVSVLLRRAARGVEEPIVTDDIRPVFHRILGEREVSELLEWQPGETGEPKDGGSLVKENGKPPLSGNDDTYGRVSNSRTRPSVRSEMDSPSENVSFSYVAVSEMQNDNAGFVINGSGKRKDDDQTWPPPVNRLGMIGQNEPVARLVEQTVFSKKTKNRFSDKLLVGPAGVGKSTLARKIGEMLIDREPLFFNGSDIRRPSDFVDRLKHEGLLSGASQSGTICIPPSLLFIDEVHGISANVATVLLSAMDDRRITSIDGRLYDFNRVVFLLATTDPGKLTEAFQSRPSKTWLQPYTLHEMAGIVWLHGKESLDGAKLSQEACYEIAARNRCNPRRSVRELTETLLPHFFSRMIRDGDREPSLKDTAAIMTRENIAEFYESQGVDFNGLDNLSLRFLNYLKQHGSSSEATLRQALGLAHPQDFVEAAEYLVRLGLVETSSGGRRLTRHGEQYLRASTPPDLRDRISRAM